MTARLGSALFESSPPLASFVREILARSAGSVRQETGAAAPRQIVPLSAAGDSAAGPKNGPKRVLAIGAHPDDVELGCGGTLAKHRAMGDEVHILTLSRGAVGGDSRIRAQEATRAADILGATLQLADLPDTRIPDGIETIEIIQLAMRSFSPTHVYTHSCHDTHQDHRSAHAATLVAVRRVNNIYAYQSPSSSVDFRPNHFVDVANYIDKKIEALAAHESQLTRSGSLRADFVVATALYWGRHLGHTMAEPMEIIHQLDI